MVIALLAVAGVYRRAGGDGDGVQQPRIIRRITRGIVFIADQGREVNFLHRVTMGGKQPR